MAKEYQDILYEVRDGVVRITINRPEVYNAFRNQTLEELIDGLRGAEEEKSANVMVLAGAGDKASRSHPPPTFPPERRLCS